MFTEEGSGEGDFTWHYVNNAVWWYVLLLPPIPFTEYFIFFDY